MGGSPSLYRSTVASGPSASETSVLFLGSFLGSLPKKKSALSMNDPPNGACLTTCDILTAIEKKPIDGNFTERSLGENLSLGSSYFGLSFIDEG
jgi:hypothetical protein